MVVIDKSMHAHLIKLNLWQDLIGLLVCSIRICAKKKCCSIRTRIFTLYSQTGHDSVDPTEATSKSQSNFQIPFGFKGNPHVRIYITISSFSILPPRLFKIRTFRIFFCHDSEFNPQKHSSLFCLNHLRYLILFPSPALRQKPPK